MRSFLALALLCGSAAAFAQSVLDGVYSNAQAQRGSRTYNRICSHCHEGGEPDADYLFDELFIDRWREAPLSFLHGFFSTRMPADEPGTLGAAVYLDVLAFLLRENGYPPGSAELMSGQLDSIQLTSLDGPKPLPPNSLVRAVGCLAQTGADWELQRAAPLARVRTADETDAAELAQAAATPLGDLRIDLRNAGNFPATALAGRKVQVKGVFNKRDGANIISVLSLADTETGC